MVVKCLELKYFVSASSLLEPFTSASSDFKIVSSIAFVSFKCTSLDRCISQSFQQSHVVSFSLSVRCLCIVSHQVSGVSVALCTVAVKCAASPESVSDSVNSWDSFTSVDISSSQQFQARSQDSSSPHLIRVSRRVLPERVQSVAVQPRRAGHRAEHRHGQRRVIPYAAPSDKA
eukprot:gene29816-36927_t